MKRYLIVLVTIVFTLTGCEVEKRKNLVVLIDNSNSVPTETMERYITNITDVITPNLRSNDMLTIQFTDACSQGQAERIYHLDLSKIDFADPKDGINKMKDSADARLRNYIKHNVANDVRLKVEAAREKRKNCGNYTDIIHSLTESKKLVMNKKSFETKTDKILNNANGNENYQYETALVIYSDMVNENSLRTLDFTKFGRLSKEDVEQKYNAISETNKIPDFQGVKILVYGATSTKKAGKFSGKQIENVKYFWDLYFHSAGAEIIGYGYDSEIELLNYLNSP